ncbi:MAG TPA: hypothetical protein VFG04_11770 [Planctomycetaceae bacterium]|jgi:tetratricopeptide (TPR) repeat protein|nr:hypothetical protein [Planctomycetaceae bacterium]
MSRTFIIALVAIAVVLAAVGGAGFWVFHMDREPPHGKQTTEAAPAKATLPVGDTIYLAFDDAQPANPKKAKRVFAFPLALRELMRQAFLITARDEFGLATRDVMLREDFPKNVDDQFIPFIMSTQETGLAQGNSFITYKLARKGPEEEDLWHTKVRFDIDDSVSITTLAEQAEALSRSELKEALTRAGGKGKVPAARASSEVPSATSNLLWAWNEISVLAGLRRVHAEIREKGESPQLLAALAVGYANLGSLTEYYYGAECKVYYARALLYAERLLRRTDQSPWALWHRGYVRVLFGLHSAGGQDIALAKKKQGTAPAAPPLPFWTEVVDAYAQGQLAQMLKVAKTPPQRHLARYLKLQAVMFGDLRELEVKAMHAFLEDVPDCPRGFDLLAASGQVGTAREGSNMGLVLTGLLVRKRLADVAGLPAPIAERIHDSDATFGSAEVEFRTTLINELELAGRSELDRGEPSLSAVGHSIEEINFAQLIRKLEVDRNTLGIPVEDTISGLGPMVAAHPYAAYIGAFTTRKPIVEAAAAALSARLPVYEINVRNLSLVDWLASVIQDSTHADLRRVAGAHADVIVSDQMRKIQGGFYGSTDASNAANATSMKHLRNTCDKLSVVVAAQISRDWPSASLDADKYEREYADDPLVMHALSDRYFKLKRYDDAERCAKQHVKLAPGYSSYRALAAVYKGKNDPVHWKETLDKAIKLPSAGLEQAQVQDEIALDLLEQKKWDEAVVYADAAAQSFSSWSLMTAARCHEMVGEWDKAEALAKVCSARYDDHVFNWMCWCHRTGRGDVQAADAFTRNRIDGWGSQLFPAQLQQFGIYYLMTGEPKKAMPMFERSYQTSHDLDSAFHAALIADAVRKPGMRDRYLRLIAAPPKSKPQGNIDLYYRLGAQFRQAVAANAPQKVDLAEVDKILAAAEEAHLSPALSLYVGLFFKNRGEAESAKKYLIRCAQSNDWDGVEHTLACQLLREMKVILPADKAPPKKDAPKALPKDQKLLDVDLGRPRRQPA